jgi:hypothetical protein
MPFVRRRPLLRAAAVGGTAYMMGKSRAQQQQEQYAPSPAYEQPAPQVPAQPKGVADQLAQLSTLRDQGALTDEEFAAAKARLLNG